MLGPFIKCKYSDFFSLHSVSEEYPRGHIIIYHCSECYMLYEYQMICVKLFQILVSVLDLVPKSHDPLTIARLSLAIVYSRWDLETTSKSLTWIWNIKTRPWFSLLFIEGKRYDSCMMWMSALLDALEEYSHSPTWEPLCIYGDPAYPLVPTLVHFLDLNLLLFKSTFNCITMITSVSFILTRNVISNFPPNRGHF